MHYFAEACAIACLPWPWQRVQDASQISLRPSDSWKTEMTSPALPTQVTSGLRCVPQAQGHTDADPT